MYYIDDVRLYQDMYFEHLPYALFDINHPDFKLKDIATYTGILYHIECFVDAVLSLPEASLVGYFDAFEELRTRYNHLIPRYLDVLKLLSEHIDYSERIETFVRCCQAQEMKWNAIYCFKVLVADIDRLWEEQRLQTQIVIKKHHAINRYQDYERYVTTLFELFPLLDALEIRLYYRQDLLNIKTVQDASNDLNKLFRKRRDSSVFRGMQGYIAKLAYSPRNGIHCHLILFYDDIKTNHFSFSHLASHLINYWKFTITNGEGGDPNYVNADVEEVKLPRLIRFVQNPAAPVFHTPLSNVIKNRMDKNVQKIKFARYPDLLLLIEFLCHVDRFMKPIDSSGVKLIRRGDYPTKKRIKPKFQRNQTKSKRISVT